MRINLEIRALVTILTANLFRKYKTAAMEKVASISNGNNKRERKKERKKEMLLWCNVTCRNALSLLLIEFIVRKKYLWRLDSAPAIL